MEFTKTNYTKQKKDVNMAKKTLLSLATLVTLSSIASAGAITLYQDTKTGAIYTKPGANRVELGDFVGAKEQYIKEQTTLSKINKKIGAKVKSGVPTLKINGLHFLGYTYTDDKTSDDKDTSKFETRRNYLQAKAYWNKKDHMRVALDTYQDKTDGSWKVRLKYAYLYLNNVLPHTSVELGQAHRPWIDWESSHGWLYRSISKTFIDDKTGAYLVNSSDIGINFKTKMDYFSSEIGIYNGEGYSGKAKGDSMSYEWRLTANILGTGKKRVRVTEDEYFNISLTGQIENEGYYKKDAYGNDFSKRKWWGIHAVYNQPMFLIAGMYIDSSSSTYNKGKGCGTGYSINGEFRPANKWSVFGRYDYWKTEDKDDAGKYRDLDKDQYVAGVAYKYSKNLKFVGGFKSHEAVDFGEGKANQYMLFTEIRW